MMVGERGAFLLHEVVRALCACARRDSARREGGREGGREGRETRRESGNWPKTRKPGLWLGAQLPKVRKGNYCRDNGVGLLRASLNRHCLANAAVVQACGGSSCCRFFVLFLR